MSVTWVLGETPVTGTLINVAVPPLRSHELLPLVSTPTTSPWLLMASPSTRSVNSPFGAVIAVKTPPALMTKPWRGDELFSLFQPTTVPRSLVL
jgi:hypothetical protein